MMSAWLAAAALGSAAISGVSSRNRQKEADAGFAAGASAIDQGIGKIDEFSGLADSFAGLGQESYDKYTGMFGDLEDTLHDYYTNLNPDELAAQGNQTAQQQYQQSMNQVNDQMAAQGISNSGVTAQTNMALGNQMAQTKSQNIVNAPHQVAEMQQGWMNYGAGRQDNAWNQMSQGVQMQSSATNMYNQAYGNLANMYSGQAANNQQLASQGISDMGKGMTAAAYFYGKG